jgi:hypothetical protein
MAGCACLSSTPCVRYKSLYEIQLLFRRKACACSARFFCQGSALRSDERLIAAALDSADGHAQGCVQEEDLFFVHRRALP